MFVLQVLAWQGDGTPVITFQLARETSNRAYPEIGVPDPHHPLSHHGNDPAKIARMAKVNQFHVSLFAEYLGKLKATREGDGSLLDHSLLLYGSGMGNPKVHDHGNLPILVAGGAACGMKGGRHIRFNKPTPLHKIAPPPFYAAWSTPILHDCLTGLRTNTKAQVINVQGQVIPGLYCAGESQGGFAQHGLGRTLVFGRIAGREAALSGGKV